MTTSSSSSGMTLTTGRACASTASSTSTRRAAHPVLASPALPLLQNQFAEPGGLLHREVWEARRPSSSIAAAEGMPTRATRSIRGVIDTYARSPRDRFLGIQFHEWLQHRHRLGPRQPRVPQGERVTSARLQAQLRTTAAWEGSWRPVTRATTRTALPRKRRRSSPAECQRYQARKLADFHGLHDGPVSERRAWPIPELLRGGARSVNAEHGQNIPMARRPHCRAGRGAVRQEGRGQFGSYYARPWGNRRESVVLLHPL